TSRFTKREKSESSVSFATSSIVGGGNASSGVGAAAGATPALAVRCVSDWPAPAWSDCDFRCDQRARQSSAASGLLGRLRHLLYRCTAFEGGLAPLLPRFRLIVGIGKRLQMINELLLQRQRVHLLAGIHHACRSIVGKRYRLGDGEFDTIM